MNSKIEKMKDSSLVVVQQKLQGEIKSLMEEKQSLQNEQDKFNEKFSHANSQNQVLQDKIVKQATENTKLLVSGNHEAKAKYFNKIKMDLIGAEKQSAQLQEKIRQKDKKDDQQLKKIMGSIT